MEKVRAFVSGKPGVDIFVIYLTLPTTNKRQSAELSAENVANGIKSRKMSKKLILNI